MVESNPDNYQLFNTLIEKNEVHWKRLSPEQILCWLHNFSNEEEIHCALVLADNILYYNLDDIRTLYRYILTNKVKIHLINEKFQPNTLSNIDGWFVDYLQNKCIFVSFGRAGKSAASMSYIFEQSHEIEGLRYMDLNQFLIKPGDLAQVEKVFLIDDFIGSGKQASTEWKKKENEKDPESKSLSDIKGSNRQIDFIYLALAGYHEGRKAIEATMPVKVILGQELDDRFKCFSNNSVVFKDADLRATAKKIMEEKGRVLYKFPLGFDNMELAVAFEHNTPNNSLPVIWKKPKDGSWFPLFERYEKDGKSWK